MSRFHGVVVLLAKKREKGRTPSLAISCLTGVEERMLVLKSRRAERTRTSRRGKSHDHDVSKNTKGYDSRHDAWSKIVAENFAEEHSGHVEVFVQSLIHRYSAQLWYGQVCPKEVVIAPTYAILTSMNKTTTNV